MWSPAIHDTIIGWRKPISSVLSCEASATFRHKLATPASPPAGGDKLETFGEKPVMGKKESSAAQWAAELESLKADEPRTIRTPSASTPGPRSTHPRHTRAFSHNTVPGQTSRDERPRLPCRRGPSRSGSGLVPERRVRCRTRPMRPNGASKRRTQLRMHPMRPNRGQQCLIGLRLRPMRPSGASKRRIQLRLRPMRPSGSPQRLKACGRPSDDSSLGAGRYVMVPRQRRNRCRGTKRSLCTVTATESGSRAQWRGNSAWRRWGRPPRT